MPSNHSDSPISTASLTDADVAYLTAFVATLPGNCSVDIEVCDEGERYGCVMMRDYSSAWAFGVVRTSAGISAIDYRDTWSGRGWEALDLGIHPTMEGACEMIELSLTLKAA